MGMVGSGGTDVGSSDPVRIEYAYNVLSNNQTFSF